MTEKPETERLPCTDCFALPGHDNTRITYVKTGGGASEVWHAPDCPALVIMRINMEEGSNRVREQDEWAQGVFPGAHERLTKAAAAMPADAAAQPFVEALSELVQAQADTTGFVVLHRWVEILERGTSPRSSPTPTARASTRPPACHRRAGLRPEGTRQSGGVRVLSELLSCVRLKVPSS